MILSTFYRGKVLKKLLLRSVCLVLLLQSFNVNAEIAMQKTKIHLKENSIELAKVVKLIEGEIGYKFFFSEDEINTSKKINVDFTDPELSDIVEQVFGEEFQYRIVGDNTVVISPKAVKVEQQQKQERLIKGKVVDEKGNPLPGVTVLVQGTTNGVATNGRGRYEISVRPNDALKFSSIGYKDKIKLVDGKEKLDIQLIPSTESIDEVSVVAFGEQKKESAVSSITSVKAEALQSSSSDLTTSLAGKVSGMIAWSTGGAPGAMTEEEMNTKFYIRGITSFQTDANIDPLIILDGIEISKLDLSRINPDDIDQFNVLKDASATAMYGARGANGVIVVTSKKGEAGKVYTSFRYEKVLSMATNEIDVVNPVDYMRFYNQARTGRDPSLAPKYTAETIERTASGKYPDYVYPATDWKDMLFKDNVINNHYALNIRGGSDRVQYYASLTYNDDEGMLKTDRLNQFDVNIDSKLMTFRTNLNINLTQSAKLVLNSFTSYDKYHGPLIDVRAAYHYALKASPVDFAPVYPADDYYNWPGLLRFGSNGDSDNPYAELHAGYKEKRRYSTINKMEYIQNLNSLCKGLEMRATVSMSKRGLFTSTFELKPGLFDLTGYDHITGKHTLIQINEGDSNDALNYNAQASGTSASTSMDYQLRLLHHANWGNHQTSLTGVFMAQERNISNPGSLTAGLAQRNLGYSTRATYGYKDKYFVEASLGINGSERFADKNKIGYFPAFGAGWIVTREDFMNQSAHWLSHLKLRGSYGRVGNDGVIKNPRFVYLEDVSEKKSGGVRMGTGAKGDVYSMDSYANPETTWEVAEQINLGAEVKLFNGLVDMNVDVYQETRHNIYSYRTTLPSTMGLENPPLDNIGKARSRGIDISGKIQHAFNSDFWFILNGTFTYNKSTFLQIEEAAGKPAWQKKKGHDISQQFGYIAEGLFHDQDEINNSPYQAGELQPGDIRYRDIDGNGKIDINDAVPIGHPQTPRIIYGFSTFVHYKGFEFNMSFQGAGNRSFWINPDAVTPFAYGRALLTEIAKDHWTEDNQKEMPLWPKLSTRKITDHNPLENYSNSVNKEVRRSTYFMRNGRFLRCKSIELGYYLKKNWIENIGLESCKFYARTNNPFVISDFKLWDVELGGNGFNYPIQKTYSMGVNIRF